MTIEEAIEAHDQFLGKMGWGLDIYMYPPEGSKTDWASGRGTFTVHRYHISSRLPISSSSVHGIHTVHDDLAEGIMEIVNWAAQEYSWVENAGVNSQHVIRTETRLGR